MADAEMTIDQQNWLRNNRSLRMDANEPLFPVERRAFHLDRYAFARAYCQGKRVLDGACGTGYGSALVGEVADRVAGIDCSDEAVGYARQKYGTDHISFRRSFVELTPFEDGAFDVVLSFETVEHTLCPMAHMREICRLLEPEHGRAILSVPNRWGYTDHHFFDFDLPMFESILAPFFSGIEFFYQNPATAGSAHPGIGPLGAIDPNHAQCILAVCTGPRQERAEGDRWSLIMDEIYRNAFERHREFRTLAYRQNTSLAKRAWYRLRRLAGEALK